MAYDKETRAELMEEERNEDIREKSNEIDDGDFETWCLNNKEHLQKTFFENTKEEYEEFCKDEWREHNNNL